MKRIHVAVGVIIKDGAVLVALRKPDAHMGGFWEFPGGKVEPGESTPEALTRELSEELAITCTELSPLHCYTHTYPDRQVILDVWQVHAFAGEACGAEGQLIEWVSIGQLIELEMLPANRPIVNAIRLPRRYGISEEPVGASEDFIQRCRETIDSRQLKCFQLRAKNLSFRQLISLSKALLEPCRELGSLLIVNGDPQIFDYVDVDGVHLSQRCLAEMTQPLTSRRKDKLLGLSCHSEEEIHQANSLNLDYLSISPVLKTTSHPEAKPLGWEKFEALSALSQSPVFALGGVSEENLFEARKRGAHGIAGISSFYTSISE